MFKGSIPALITPFKNGAIDWPAFEYLIEWQIKQGTHAVVPCGTTGESPTLSHEEHNAIVKRCVEIVNKRIPVIAGTGSNSTQEAIELTQEAKAAGVDAALIMTPYYNKPTQDGMKAHFQAIHNSVDLPIIIYNIPGRCVVDMNPYTMADLAKLPNIVGTKDATANMERVILLRELVGDDFCQLSGDDATIAAFMAQGGHGCISVVANIAPDLSANLHNAWHKGDFKTVWKMRDLLAPLSRDLFCETSPAPIKYAASLLGLCDNELRLPMVQASPQAREKVENAMKHAGLQPVQKDAPARKRG
jgi:4-hydroxy-tetrahydrodipicolinate synthase